jgi:hypothetical protein
MNKIWRMVRRITGKPVPNHVNHLKVNGQYIEEIEDIANTLADIISENSSSDHYTNWFR